MNIKNKKAQVSDTMTWLIGFVIIFLIMFLFSVGTLALAGKKKVTREENNIQLINSGIADLISQKQADSKFAKTSALIVQLVKNFLEEDYVKNDKGFSEIQESRVVNSGTLFKPILMNYNKKSQETTAKNAELIKEIGKTLSEQYKKYLIQTPVGVLYKDLDKPLYLSFTIDILDIDYEVEYARDYNLPVLESEQKVIDKNYVFEIKYTEIDWSSKLKNEKTE